MTLPRVDDLLSDVHPKSLRVELSADPHREGKRLIGEALAKALLRAGITKQEAAYALGYTDPGVISRWTSGVEHAQFGKLWLLGRTFRQELLLMLAEADGMKTETSIAVVTLPDDESGLQIATRVSW